MCKYRSKKIQKKIKNKLRYCTQQKKIKNIIISVNILELSLTVTGDFHKYTKFRISA